MSPTKRSGAAAGLWTERDSVPGEPLERSGHRQRKRQRDEERTQVMQHQVLDPVNEEHVLGKIVEARLHHEVDRCPAGEERQPPAEGRMFARRGGREVARVPGDRADAKEKRGR
jgi:hypothetical protein